MVVSSLSIATTFVGLDACRARLPRPRRENPLKISGMVCAEMRPMVRLVWIPRREVVAAVGIGGGGLRLRYRGWRDPLLRPFVQAHEAAWCPLELRIGGHGLAPQELKALPRKEAAFTICNEYTGSLPALLIEPLDETLGWAGLVEELTHQ